MPDWPGGIDSICGMVTGAPFNMARDGGQILGEAAGRLLAELSPDLLRSQLMAAYADGVEAVSGVPPARTIGAREFKDNCLQILREVNETGEVVVVTRHKVPIAQISAPRTRPGSLFGRCVGELRILDDITEPVFRPEEFDMEARPERVLDPEGYDRSNSG